MNITLAGVAAVILAGGVFLYVLLDGFDLGIGILFPFARSDSDRDLMMGSVAPYWDGNETWLVLGGVGLLAAFPLAYAIVLPAMYIPVIAMLLGLILRGVAFEFRARAERRGKRFWTAAFAIGSFVAAFSQGLVLGGFVQGIPVLNGKFAGDAFSWLTPYAVLVACGLVFGYALLGACWLVLRTSDALHGDARRWAFATAPFVAGVLLAVSVLTLRVNPQAAQHWGIGSSIDWAMFLPHLLIPALGAAGLALVYYALSRAAHFLPFAGALLVFASGYAGLAASFAPYIVPYSMTYAQAAAADNALALLLGGTAILLPLILGYTAWVYWVFRGKVSDALYH